MAAVASNADLVERIAGFVACPFGLRTLLALLPYESLSLPYQSLWTLSTAVPLCHLWPQLRVAVLTSPGHAVAAAELMALRPVVRIDTSPIPRFPFLRHASTRVALRSTAALSTVAHMGSHGGIVELSLALRTDATLHDIALARRVLASFVHLRVLELSWLTSQTGVVLSPLLATIARLPRLADLTIACPGVHGLPPFAVTFLVTWLGTGRAEAVRLRHIDLGDVACEAVAMALHASRSLRILDLDDTNGIAFDFMQTPLPRTLQSLCLTKGFAIVGTFLPVALRQSHLETLHFDATATPGLLDTLRTLPTLHRLSHLRLSLHQLDDATADCLSQILPRLLSLVALELEWMEEAAAVPAVHRCPRLQRLALRGPGNGAAAWVCPPTLRHLCLRGADRASVATDPALLVCCVPPTRRCAFFQPCGRASCLAT
ncbi:hypothetical protein SDRG_04752 [Saprolegnia diclina VS20]|uniref:F-box domain-containing protein n=1 Tax=Saprolegnia diclina (strain VS20) TaxID=1156394 RepID=T0QUM0_SAPDV|nr:hypothetical protein SDRG_04752 [Saprolegnia diclina VS20]EQC37725.1 hypothetical protein SDRG_04752 [Saprolegnia diclina VS20]|eukprot:XP_008608658.1 hypothetical protein SDRG_04752 [Saprolegnia diclina VS20]